MGTRGEKSGGLSAINKSFQSMSQTCLCKLEPVVKGSCQLFIFCHYVTKLEGNRDCDSTFNFCYKRYLLNIPTKHLNFRPLLKETD